jgi:hypothetical protein
MGAPPSDFSTASHAILFEPEDERCSVCSGEVDLDDDRDLNPEAESPRASGRGLLVWARGDDIRREEPLLCGNCAMALGMTALHRWETEEDEG